MKEGTAPYFGKRFRLVAVGGTLNIRSVEQINPKDTPEFAERRTVAELQRLMVGWHETLFPDETLRIVEG